MKTTTTNHPNLQKTKQNNKTQTIRTNGLTDDRVANIVPPTALCLNVA